MRLERTLLLLEKRNSIKKKKVTIKIAVMNMASELKV